MALAQQKLIVAHRRQYGRYPDSGGTVCKPLEGLGSSYSGALDQFAEDPGNKLSRLLRGVSPGLGPVELNLFGHLTETPDHVSGVEEQEDLAQTPAVVVHEDVFDDCRSGPLVPISLRRDMVFLGAASGTAHPVFGLEKYEFVELTPQLPDTLRDQDGIAVGDDFFLIGAKNWIGGREAGGKLGKQITPAAADFLGSEISRWTQILCKNPLESLLGDRTRHHKLHCIRGRCGDGPIIFFKNVIWVR